MPHTFIQTKPNSKSTGLLPPHPTDFKSHQPLHCSEVVYDSRRKAHTRGSTCWKQLTSFSASPRVGFIYRNTNTPDWSGNPNCSSVKSSEQPQCCLTTLEVELNCSVNAPPLHTLHFALEYNLPTFHTFCLYRAWLQKKKKTPFFSLIKSHVENCFCQLLLSRLNETVSLFFFHFPATFGSVCCAIRVDTCKVLCLCLQWQHDFTSAEFKGRSLPTCRWWQGLMGSRSCCRSSSYHNTDCRGCVGGDRITQIKGESPRCEQQGRAR